MATKGDPHAENVSGVTREGKRPTLKDVAARAGVSRALVSLVIRNDAGPSAHSRERVLRAAAELGYRPDPVAQALRSQRSRLLGLVVDLHDTFHADVVDAIYPVADQLGYHVELKTSEPTQDKTLAMAALVGAHCEGVVLLGSTVSLKHPNGWSPQLPLVVIGRGGKGSPVDLVRNADNQGTGQAVDYLVSLGHHAITYIDGGRRPETVERRRGYRNAMSRHGLARGVHVIREEVGASAVRLLLEQDDLPTAIMAGDDSCAIGLLIAFARVGVKVPQDVSIVGWGDDQLARLDDIRLTTVRPDAAQIGELAVRAIAERLDEGRTIPTDIQVTPKLVVRGTTAPPRQDSWTSGEIPRPRQLRGSTSASR